MGMKYKDPTTGNFKEINVKVADTLPVGSEVDYNGTTIPTGWEEVDSPNDYSTEETRIGTWIDGKPIYRKVFDFGQLPVTGRKEISHGISDLSRIIKLYGIASWNAEDMPTITLPSADPDGGKYSVYLSANSSIIAVTTGSDRGDFYGYVVMEYTKK